MEVATKAKFSKFNKIIGDINFALKALRLYPPSHRVTKEAVDRLSMSINDFLGSREALTIVTANKRVGIAGTDIWVEDRRLSQLLRRHKLRSICFIPGLERQELLDLLSLICSSRDKDIKKTVSRESITDFSRPHIKIEKLALKVIELNPEAVDVDEIESPAALERLSDLLTSDTPAVGNEHLLILRHLHGNIDQVINLLLRLSAAANDKAAASEPATSLLRLGVPKILDAVKHEKPEKQRRLWAKLWAALKQVPETERRCFYHLILADLCRDKHNSRFVIENLTVAEIVDIIRQAVGFEGKADKNFRALMLNLPLSREKIKEIASITTEKYPELLDDDNVLEALIGREKQLYQEPDSDLTLKDKKSIAAFCLKEEPERLSRLQKEVERTSIDSLNYASIPLLREIISGCKDEARFKTAALELSKIADKALSAGRFPLLKLIITAFKQAATDADKLELKVLADNQRRQICGHKAIYSLVDNFASNPTTTNLLLIKRLLKKMGAAGIHNLMELLAVEERVDTRKTMCRLLTAAGREDIDVVGRKINDQRWYFVRNVALILGRSRREEAVAYLSKIIDHPEKRVRREVIEALRNIGGRQAVDLLLKFLNETEAELYIKAVNALGSLRETAAAPILIAYLEEKNLYYSRWEITEATVAALGNIGDRRALPVLNKLKTKNSWLFRQKNQLLREAAAAAAAKIQNEDVNGAMETGNE